MDAAPVTTPVKTVVRQPKRVFVPRRRVVYYVPTFQGTYAKPSPIYTRWGEGLRERIDDQDTLLQTYVHQMRLTASHPWTGIFSETA